MAPMIQLIWPPGNSADHAVEQAVVAEQQLDGPNFTTDSVRRFKRRGQSKQNGLLLKLPNHERWAKCSAATIDITSRSRLRLLELSPQRDRTRHLPSFARSVSTIFSSNFLNSGATAPNFWPAGNSLGCQCTVRVELS